MPDRTCSVEGCGKSHHAHGFCAAHNHRFTRFGDPLGGGPCREPAGQTCKIDDCGRPAQSRGWCSAHYQRFLKTGDPLKIRPAKWDGYERPVCSVEGCAALAHARGLCSIHAPRRRRHGDPLAGRRQNVSGTTTERFWAQVERRGEGECWPWTTGLFPTGYGQFSPGMLGPQYAHRWSYELNVGPIPAGLTIDHRCHNEDQICPGGPGCLHRRCVNPAHLEPVTHAENIRRARRRSNEP